MATFIQFDKIDFYPSISKEILIGGSNYPESYVEITDEQYQIILVCRKTVLKNNDSTWIKTGLDNPCFYGWIRFCSNTRSYGLIYIKYP